MSSSSWISPTTSPSGCAERSNCMIRNLGSVPMAENMSAYFATCSVVFLLCAVGMFLYLQKYRTRVKSGIEDNLSSPNPAMLGGMFLLRRAVIGPRVGIEKPTPRPAFMYDVPLLRKPPDGRVDTPPP